MLYCIHVYTVLQRLGVVAMATVVVSGRVDSRVKERAETYIRAAGLSTGDVIRVVWEEIARTGEVPDSRGTLREAESNDGPLERLGALRGMFAESDLLVDLTKEQMRNLIASRYA